MSTIDRKRLAIEGGEPVCRRKLPVPFNASGRHYGEAELHRLRAVLERGTLTRWGGATVDELEREWAALVGARNAIAVSSGTASLHTALACLQSRPGNEVVTSPITDIGTILAILHNHLVPVFADTDPRTGMITEETVGACLTPETVAIMPVHLFGRCTGVDALAQLACERRIALVEDSSQAQFSKLDGKCAGTFGDLGCFSLQQTKVVSCGEGGVVVTDDDDMAERARLFQNKGWARSDKSERSYPVLGLNYRLGELAAAVALGQLEAVEQNIAMRAASHRRAVDLMTGVRGVSVSLPGKNEEASWWALAVRFDRAETAEISEFVERALAQEGVRISTGLYRRAPDLLQSRGRRPGAP